MTSPGFGPVTAIEVCLPFRPRDGARVASIAAVYHAVLFLHLAVVMAAFTLSGVLHGCEWVMRRAATVAEVRTLAKPGALGPLFGLITVLLLGFGAWLLHLSKRPAYGWGDPFVWTAVLALVAAMGLGIGVMGPAHERLTAAAAAAGDGPVSPELRAVVLERPARIASHVNTFLVLGVVLNMTTKPGTAVAVLDLVVGAVLGALIGLASARPVGTPAPGSATSG